MISCGNLGFCWISGTWGPPTTAISAVAGSFVLGFVSGSEGALGRSRLEAFSVFGPIESKHDVSEMGECRAVFLDARAIRLITIPAAV